MVLAVVGATELSLAGAVLEFIVPAVSAPVQATMIAPTTAAVEYMPRPDRTDGRKGARTDPRKRARTDRRKDARTDPRERSRTDVRKSARTCDYPRAVNGT